jgi:hypothetical protein
VVSLRIGSIVCHLFYPAGKPLGRQIPRWKGFAVAYYGWYPFRLDSDALKTFATMGKTIAIKGKAALQVADDLRTSISEVISSSAKIAALLSLTVKNIPIIAPNSLQI